MNKVILIGRATKDWELRYTPSGVAVANGNIAVDKPFTSDGERKADFIDLVAWRKTAELAANYIRKGQRFGLEGSIQVRKYEKDGQNRYAYEVLVDRIEFLESNRNGNASEGQDPFANDGKPVNLPDDDLPF
ncbi:single-stranded DNA-binding protein [Cohnella sp. AR92]|uniref:single-stranded DNA-binding protein n=1 Tax=Cohnella sp. AR92 TaxID=648716 RepID=UPI000F8E0A36|nr:single-stranded DNA-binding protein [Cohnella sp. AR92]RUS42246.1 single-stranded DNA-binding protein [Cohnella sp. AR92]